MIRPLRTRHAVIWSVLAIVVPLSIIVGRAVTPTDVASDLSLRAVPPPLPQVLATVDRDDARFALRGRTDGALQLEVVVERPLSAPGIAIHAAPDAPSAPSAPSASSAPAAGASGSSADRDCGPVIGVLGVRGVYRFPLVSRPRVLVLRDPVREEILGEVRFEEHSP